MLLTRKKVISGVVLCAGTAFSYADSNGQASPSDIYNLSLAELGQMQISIATGNGTPLDKAPATASVISSAEIEAMGARTLNDVLEIVPGLHTALSSLSRLDSIYSIRGIHTGFNPQVLLLLNGVPVKNNVQGGRPTLFRMPVGSIDRVEVIRGPGSAVYGADAYAGVINVITKDAAAIDNTHLEFRAGAFNSYDFSLQTATQWNGVGIAFDTAYQETDGDQSRRINSDLQSTLDAAFGTHASLAPGALSTRYHLFDSHLALTGESAQFNLWNWRSINAGLGAGAADALDSAGREDSDVWMGDFTYHLNKTDSWDNSVRLSYLQYKERVAFNILPAGTVVLIGGDGNLDFVHPAGVVAFPDGIKGNPGADSKDYQFDLITVYTGLDSQRIRVNIGARQESLTAVESKNFGPGVLSIPLPQMVSGDLTDVSNTENIFLENSSRSVRYLSLQDEWQLKAGVDLTTGVRYDDYSDFGSTINPRVALVWATNDRLTTKLLYGSAFRAPSFAELYYKNNPVSLGNRNLRPEKIDTQELSFNYLVADNLQTNLTFFKYLAKDMIEFVPDQNATTKTAQNARDQNGNGVELEVVWKPSPRFHVGANYSYQNSRELQTRTAVPDAPGKQFKLNANLQILSNVYLNGQLEWIGDRQRALGDLRSNVADYTLVNANLIRKDLLPNLDLSFAVHNLANADAREPSSGIIPDDYPLESRSVWLGLTYTIK